MDFLALGVAKNFTRDTAQGMGAVKGNDGISPAASIRRNAAGDGVTITITDATGTTQEYLLDGQPGDKGDPGEGVPAGGTAGQVLVKKSDTDFDTQWQEPQGGGHPADPSEYQKKSEIGELADLATTEKKTIVGAVNEVWGKIPPGTGGCVRISCKASFADDGTMAVTDIAETWDEIKAHIDSGMSVELHAETGETYQASYISGSGIIFSRLEQAETGNNLRIWYLFTIMVTADKVVAMYDVLENRPAGTDASDLVVWTGKTIQKKIDEAVGQNAGGGSGTYEAITCDISGVKGGFSEFTVENLSKPFAEIYADITGGKDVILKADFKDANYIYTLVPSSYTDSNITFTMTATGGKMIISLSIAIRNDGTATGEMGAYQEDNTSGGNSADEVLQVKCATAEAVETISVTNIDKTFAEMKAAFDDGHTVELIDDKGMVYKPLMYNSAVGIGFVNSMVTKSVDETPLLRTAMIMVMSDDTTQGTIQNNAFLTVDDVNISKERAWSSSKTSEELKKKQDEITGTENQIVAINADGKAMAIDGSVIKSIDYTPSDVDGGTNKLSITLSDGTVEEFNILNGSKGEKGDKGDDGKGVTTGSVSCSSSNTGSSHYIPLCDVGSETGYLFTHNGSVVPVEKRYFKSDATNGVGTNQHGTSYGSSYPSYRYSVPGSNDGKTISYLLF